MSRTFLALITTLLALALPAISTPAREPGGISSAAISRCAGKLGSDTRRADPAFGVIMLDGMPWVTIERTEERVGTQRIATTVTGTGARRRRDGTSVPFRFTCLLDQHGQAVMFHANQIAPTLGDALPPATVVEGSVTYMQRMALPQGAELLVQLLDTGKTPADIVAEQVVRSGWQVPIPFALRLPKDMSLDGRKLAVTARLVVLQQTLFELKLPRSVSTADLAKPVELALEQPATPAR
jgi:putative lipoprotein